MSPSVCQELTPCPEPPFIEPCDSRLKSVSPKSNCKSNNNEKNSSGWDFIQALTNTSYNSKEAAETEKVYVHPVVKRSSSTLSTKSLEMCTESLGSETGSEEFSSLSWEKQSFHGVKRSKSRELAKKMNRTGSFPPPLTSINSCESVQVRPYRENGRLVIKAVTVSSSNTCFQAERINGRLRLSLSLLKDNCDTEFVKNEELYDNEVETEAEEDEYDDDGDVCWGEDMEGNSENVGCEIEIGEFPVPRRCKESGNENKVMSNWGPFWVAIT